MLYVWQVVLYVAGCAVLANAMSDEFKGLMDSLHKQCVAETGVSEDVVKQAQGGTLADDEKLKCYIRCVLDKGGLFGGDGKIIVDSMIGILPEEVRDGLAPTIRKCAVLEGSSPCDTIFIMYQCIYADAPTLYFLP